MSITRRLRGCFGVCQRKSKGLVAGDVFVAHLERPLCELECLVRVIPENCRTDGNSM